MKHMICDNCKIDRKSNDFIKNQKYCFRCEYQIKLKNVSKKQTRKALSCRCCGGAISHNENLKKRQRNIFCSAECAQQGQKIQSNNHWTRLVRLRRIPV